MANAPLSQQDFVDTDNLLSLIFDTAEISICITDEQGRFVQVNRAYQRLYGWSAAELMGQHFCKVLPRHQRESARKVHDAFLQGADESAGELQILRKDGAIRDVQVTAGRLLSKGGRRYKVTTLTDITERKRTETALRKSKENLTNILERITDAFFALDQQWRFTYLNRQAERLLQRSRKDLLGKIIWEEFPQTGDSIFSQQYRKAVAQQVTVEFEGFYPPLNKWLAVHAYPSNDGLSVYFRNITEAKQAREQLRRSEELYRTLAKNFPNGAVLLFDQELRFTLAEGAGLASVGLSKELLEGRTLGEVFPSEVCTAIEPNYQAALAGETRVAEIAYEGRFYSVHTLPVTNEQGEILAGMMMTQEITAQKKVEAALKQGKELLGVQVEEQTQQLRQANKQLRSEITERRRVEVALRESHRQLVTLLESITDAFFTLDFNWQFTYLNKKAEQYLQHPKEELLGQLMWQVFPMGVESSFYTQCHHALSNKVPVTFEEFHPSLDKWFEVRAYPSAVGLSIFFNDITERKTALAQLEKQQQTLRAILDHAPIWIWMTDTRGQMHFINKTFCEDVGIPESRFLEIPYVEVLGIEEAAGCVASDTACFASDTPHQSEETLPFVDGQMHDLEILKAKIKDASGEVMGLIGLAVDVTERKAAQRSLELSEAKFRELAQREELLNRLSNQIRTSLDLDTILETMVQEIRTLFQIDRCLFTWYRLRETEQGSKEVNPNAYWETVKEARDPHLPSHVGSYPAERVGPLANQLLTLEILQADDVQQMPDPVMRQFLLSLGYVSILFLPIQTRDSAIGVIVCGECHSLRAWSDDEVELLQAVGAQLTIAIHQANLYTQTCEAAKQARLQAQQLEEAYQVLQRTQTQLVQSEKMSSLGQLVAGVAHEINNPVNFIYGNLIHAQEYTNDLLKLLQLYQQEYPHPTPALEAEITAVDIDFLLEDLPKLLCSMKLGSDRIRQIVQSLRNFSRLDEAARKEVDLHEGIDSTLLILQNRLKAKPEHPGIMVIKEYSDLPPVECYAGQLNQVFMNLLTNAIDALDECIQRRSKEGNLEVPPVIRIRTQLMTPNRVTISIADNGSGMPEAIKQRLFDPFFTTKPVGKGTGLGLAISYQIVVEKHGGELKCFSTLGKGTEFVIEIPLRQPPCS